MTYLPISAGPSQDSQVVALTDQRQTYTENGKSLAMVVCRPRSRSLKLIYNTDRVSRDSRWWPTDQLALSLT